MEDLLHNNKIIQQDPELWEKCMLVEQLKHQDQEPMEFFDKCSKYVCC